jgi:hypothetical protein
MTRFSLASLATAVTLLTLVPLAHADRTPLSTEPGDFTLKIESGIAIPMTRPQSDRFEVGGGQTVKALWALNPYLDIGPSVTFLALPTSAAQGDFGTAWNFGGGLRLKRPHDAPDDDKFSAISPWVDADALFVRTGDLNRPGLAIAAGLSLPIGETRTFWLGPFVRYLHILQGTRSGFDSHDGKILSVGLSLEMGTAVRREPAPVVAPVVSPAPEVITKEVISCPDRDKDQLADNVDRCPDVVGPI